MEIVLSSSKRGFGLKELLSSNKDEYWNTDDTLPHFIWITFPRKTYVYAVHIGFSYIQDESYTPERVSLHFNDKNKEFQYFEPEGEKELKIDAYVFDIYLSILNNHTEGKDSRIRSLRIMNSPTTEIKCYKDGA